MKPFVPLALLATLLALALPTRAADTVLTMDAYGPIKIGMTVDEVHRLLQKMGRRQLPNPKKTPKKGCSRYEASAQLKFMALDGKIVRIETREPDVVTPSGLRIGTSIERVRRTLGSRLDDRQQPGADDPKARTLVLESGDRQFAIRVEAHETVQQLYAGAQHAIRHVEGCA
jgi:hypothetical protein